MKHLSKEQSGFTLTELLVAVAVTGIMIVVIMNFLVNTLVTNAVDSARADLLREVQLTLDVVGRDVKLSATADENNRWADDNAPNAPSDTLSWESDDDTLILALAAQDASRNVLFDDALHYITHKNNVIYFVDNNVLYKRTLAGNNPSNAAVTTCPAAVATSTCPADRAMIQGVTNFEVTYYDSDNTEVTAAEARSIGLSLTVDGTKYGRGLTAVYETRTVFRNE